jgi:hypothetical protein
MTKSAWDGVLRALSTTPHEIRSLRGVTGYTHSFASVGVDLERQRLVVISAETDPRIVAMAQADIQACDPSIHVIAVRPSVIDAADVWRKPEERTTKLVDWKNLEPLMSSGSAEADLLSGHALLGAMIQPLFEKLEQKPDSVDPSTPRTAGPLHQDPFALDRQFGICPVPLYQLQDSEIEAILTATDVDAIRDMLIRLGVLQYFFPPADQVALGLVESRADKPEYTVQNLYKVPGMGHPFGEKELVPNDTPLTELLDALKEQDLLIEGEYSLELTPTGRAIRSSVRFKPRESLLTKLLNRISVSFSLKDLFGGPG